MTRAVAPGPTVARGMSSPAPRACSGQDRRAARRGAAVVALALAAALSAPAGAGTFELPPGCSGLLTVQAKGCKVSHHYRCASDPEGDQWRVDFGQHGAYFASRIDFEAQWVFSVELGPGTRQWLAPDPPEPASLSALLDSGFDSYDFRLRKDTGEVTAVRGFDRLTGRTVTIDGIALRETAFEYRETAADGTQLGRARGNEYVHAGMRLFFSGPSEWEGDDGFLPIDHSPVEFIFPGEPGFLSTEPRYQCDMLMSRGSGADTALPATLPATARSEEQDHDL